MVRRSLIPALVILLLLLGASNAHAAEYEITFEPEAPVAGDQVTFHAKRVNPGNGGQNDLFTWAFGDGRADTGRNPAPHVYEEAGTYTVILVVTNADGTRSETVTTTIEIGPTVQQPPDPPPPDPPPPDPPPTDPLPPTEPLPPGDAPPRFDDSAPSSGVFGGSEPVFPGPPATAPSLMRPFPVVRIAGVVLPRGARVRILSVRGPRSMQVRVRCRGRGCPVQSMRLTSATRLARLHRFERRLAAGTTLELFVRKPGKIGKYTRFVIRAGTPPKRVDLCLFPTRRSPGRCP